MKKIYKPIILYAILLQLFCFSNSAYSQFAYSLTPVSGTYTISGGTSPSVPSADETLCSGIPIGFTFTYNCVNYTVCRLSTNGWLDFNTTGTSSLANNNLSNAPLVLAPLWDNLKLGITAGGYLKYITTGTSPNRVFTAEWYKMKWSNTASDDVISFQIKLYETTNRIEFVYNQGPNTINTSAFGATIGISGGLVGVFYSLQNASSAPTYSTSTETTTILTKPATGQIYQWDPLACIGAPIGGATVATPASVCPGGSTVLTITGATNGCGITYQWQSSPDNITWSNISLATSLSYTASPTSSTYYRCNITCSSSGLTTASTSVLVTIGSAPTNDDPCNATYIPIGTTCSFNVYTNQCATATAGVTAPGCAGYSSSDVWFTTTVPASGQLILDSKEGVITDGGMALYSGTCGALTLIQCDDDASLNGAMPYITNSSLVPFSTVFIRFWENGNDNNGTFSICAYDPCPGTAPVNDDPCNATALTINTSCNYSQFTNACSSGSIGVPAPGCASYISSDVWFVVTVPASGHLIFDSNTGTMTDGGMALYSGTCSALTLIQCDDNNSVNGAMPMIDNSSLVPFTTVWIRFWEYGNNNNGTFSLCVWDPCPSGTQANDLPCNATALPIGVILFGDNNCTNSTSEPGNPTGWTTTGNLNTVWYSIVCPASGTIRAKTYLGSLTNTQIALYSGACGSLTLVTGAVNNNATACVGGGTPLWSEINISGLSSGTTYYLRVDGTVDLVGTFNVEASDGTPFSAIPQQDCAYSTQICNQITTVGDPGFVGAGNICDFSSPFACFGSGETNSVFYNLTISTTGSLTYDIIPNVSTTDYDWMLFDITGNATYCSQIVSGALLPVRCNWSGTLGTTGCKVGYTLTSVGGVGSPFCSPVTVVAGQMFLLMVNNYSSNSTGFTLDFGLTSPIAYSGTPTSVVWTGGTNTDWFNALNWGGCSIPTCGISAIVVNGPTNQPVINAPGAICNGIIINPGANLTINGTNTLTICGDYSNDGDLNANAASTILFSNAAVIQNIDGNLISLSKFPNLTITKTGGQVNLLQDIEIGTNFTTTNSTSVFNANGHYIKLSGNFTNAAGNTTFTGTTNSTLEFNGLAAQSFSPGGSLTLNKVVVNQGATSDVNLLGDLVLGTLGVLTLTNGRITTGAFQVSCTNNNSSACSNGNLNSYVNGNLRRSTTTTGSYDFPVGSFSSGKGYQLANINFTAANTATDLLARFDAYGVLPAPLNLFDCGANYSLPTLDNGYWTITSTPSVSTGTYTTTLYNTLGTYTNSAGAAEWTVMKNSTGTWVLNGVCAASTINNVVRTGMSGFSKFGTAQAPVILPIELLIFKGTIITEGNLLEWSTASELNNDFFSLERSVDGNHFSEIGNVNGADNSYEAINYQFLDRLPAIGNNFYRLKQVNTNGSYSYSDIILLENNARNQLISSISPVPSYGVISIQTNVAVNSKINFRVFDVLNHEVFYSTILTETENPIISLDLSALAKGVYFLHSEIAGGGITSVNKIVIE